MKAPTDKYNLDAENLSTLLSVLHLLFLHCTLSNYHSGTVALLLYSSFCCHSFYPELALPPFLHLLKSYRGIAVSILAGVLAAAIV